MENSKGIAVKGAIGIILTVIFCLFILVIISSTVGGFGTAKSKARESALDIARAIRAAGSGDVSKFEVKFGEDWGININSENSQIEVLKNNKPDQTYKFDFPSGYNIVCCPKEWDSSGSCDTHCSDTLIINGPESRTFCVASMAALDSYGIGDHRISGWIHGKKYIYVYPKQSSRTCHNLLKNIFGL